MSSLNRIAELLIKIPKSFCDDKSEFLYDISYDKFAYELPNGKIEPVKTVKINDAKLLRSSKDDNADYLAFRTYEYNLLTYQQGMTVLGDTTNRKGRIIYKIYKKKDNKKTLIKEITNAGWYFKSENLFTNEVITASDIAKINAPKVPEPKKAIVFFVGGGGDKYKLGNIGPTKLMNDVRLMFAERLHRELPSLVSNVIYEESIVYLGYEELYEDWGMQEKVIRHIPNQDSLVYIVGHSLGGWAAAHLTNYLNKQKYKVQLLITLDPVGKGESTKDFVFIKENAPQVVAKQWVNIVCKPKKVNTGDVIAAIGVQWKPTKGMTYNITTSVSHDDMTGLMNTVVVNQQTVMNFFNQRH